MDKATRLNIFYANRELCKRVVSQVGEFRMLELMGEDHQTGKDTLNVSCLFPEDIPHLQEQRT
jgi:hypothetical protein